MAELDSSTSGSAAWTETQTWEQYRAIVWLRWRIFANGFRRKGGKGELIGLIIVIPLFLLVVIALAFGVAALCYLGAAKQRYELLTIATWGIFALSQLVNINMGSAGTTFDPTQLIRFPLSTRRYTLIRLFFGMMAPGNITMAILSLAGAIGLTVGRPSLWLYGFVSFGVFTLANVIFTRMIFAWVDRWLSTRRAREVFMGLIFLFSMGIQWANVEFNLNNHHHHRHHHQSDDEDEAPEVQEPPSPTAQRMMKVWAVVKPATQALPPGLAADAIAKGAVGKPLWFVAETAGVATYGLLFFGIFGLRMRTEFRGESLSDAAIGVKAKPAAKATAHETHASSIPLAAAPATGPSQWELYLTLLQKEFLYLRRTMGLIYGLVAPLFFVFLFAGRWAAKSHSEWVYPAALAYALLGVVPISYNAFGLDGTGAQFYFLAPIRLRDVLLVKNVLNSILGLIEVLAVTAMISYMAGLPSVSMLLGSMLWALMTLLVELTVGNYRSINTPKKVDLQKMGQKQASQASALMSMGILVVSAGLGWSLMMLAKFSGLAWILPVVLAAMAAVAAFFYWHNLEKMDEYAMLHRDSLFEELGKKA
ncbi:MAG: hypothetical protein PW792_01345 [Acidobacteriaceae bacterium]|nr:hypothetical protein [Acidobacteriaceae bacterium]